MDNTTDIIKRQNIIIVIIVSFFIDKNINLVESVYIITDYTKLNLFLTI